MIDRGGGVFYRAGDKIEIIEDAIAFAEGGLVEVVVHKLNGVRKRNALVTASATCKQW